MVNFDDIKNLYEEYNIVDLADMYKKRQDDNIKKNDNIAKDILFYYPGYELIIPNELGYSEKLSYLIAFILNSGDKREISNLLKLLHKFHYNYKFELLKIMQNADFYFSKELSSDGFLKFLYGATCIKKILQVSLNEAILKVNKGNVKICSLNKVLGFQEIDKTSRRGLCHNITTDILLLNKDLYGAYYYIPLDFKGYIEHSVIIDPKHNLVLDFANNVIVALDIWKKFYGNPTVVISGSEFDYLNKRCNYELSEHLTTLTLEEARLLRTKKNRG